MNSMLGAPFGQATNDAADLVPDLAIAVMPFGLCAIPSIGPATLKAAMQAQGKTARIFDFNLEYLAAMGPDLHASWMLHDQIAYLWDFLTSEWLFSPRVSADAGIAYLQDLARRRAAPGEVVEARGHLRPKAAAFADYAVRRLAASGAPVVGFSTSFMRTQSSLATAGALKHLSPDTRILFGGANCFDEMGRALLECYRRIDAVATDEAERTPPAMVEALTSGDADRAGRLPGYVTRGGETASASAPPSPPRPAWTIASPRFQRLFRHQGGT